MMNFNFKFNFKFNFWYLVLLGTIFTGCTLKRLTVQTNYISCETLASYYVGTPDPRLNNPPTGEQLIISWALPVPYLKYQDLHLEMKIRFHNREEIVQKVPIKKSKSSYIYSLLNEDYFTKKGILTYKVSVIGDECVLEEWKHQLWTELITFDHVDQDQDQDQKDSNS